MVHDMLTCIGVASGVSAILSLHVCSSSSGFKRPIHMYIKQSQPVPPNQLAEEKEGGKEEGKGEEEEKEEGEPSAMCTSSPGPTEGAKV